MRNEDLKLFSDSLDKIDENENSSNNDISSFNINEQKKNIIEIDVCNESYTQNRDTNQERCVSSILPQSVALPNLNNISTHGNADIRLNDAQFYNTINENSNLIDPFSSIKIPDTAYKSDGINCNQKIEDQSMYQGILDDQDLNNFTLKTNTPRYNLTDANYDIGKPKYTLLIYQHCFLVLDQPFDLLTNLKINKPINFMPKYIYTYEKYQDSISLPVTINSNLKGNGLIICNDTIKEISVSNLFDTTYGQLIGVQSIYAIIGIKTISIDYKKYKFLFFINKASITCKISLINNVTTIYNIENTTAILINNSGITESETYISEVRNIFKLLSKGFYYSLDLDITTRFQVSFLERFPNSNFKTLNPFFVWNTSLLQEFIGMDLKNKWVTTIIQG